MKPVALCPALYELSVLQNYVLHWRKLNRIKLIACRLDLPNAKVRLLDLQDGFLTAKFVCK